MLSCLCVSERSLSCCLQTLATVRMEPGFLARGLRILKGRVPSYSADGEELPEEVLYTVDAGWLDRRFILKKNHIHTVGVLAQVSAECPAWARRI